MRVTRMTELVWTLSYQGEKHSFPNPLGGHYDPSFIQQWLFTDYSVPNI